MVTIPMLWQLQIRGAEEVKTRFREINEQFAKGDITAAEYSKELRGVNRDARTLTNTMNMQKNIFLATHPSILKLTQAMSLVSSVSRTLLSITNAINLARIAGRQLSGEESDLLIKKAELERELMGINDDTIEGMQRRKSIEEELRVITERLNTISKEESEQAVSNYITLAGSIALIAGSMTQVLTKIGPFVTGMKGIKDALTALSLLSIPLTALLGTITAFAAVFFAAYFATMYLLDALGVTKLTLGDIEYFYWSTIEPFLADMAHFFTTTIPLALGQMVAFFANIFIEQIPSYAQLMANLLTNGFAVLWDALFNMTQRGLDAIAGAIMVWVARIRDIILNLVNWFNSLIFSPKTKGGSGVSGFAGQEGHSVINALHAAHGFEGMVTQPTMFLAGEEGPESVSVIPHSTRSGNMMGSGITIIVQGSILSERDLLRVVDKYLKGQYKAAGFT